MDIPSGFEEQLKCMVRSLRDKYDIPGISLALVKPSENLMLAHGYGVVDKTSLQPVSSHTRFAIGSITKCFTSALMASILQEQRRWRIVCPSELFKL